MTSNVGNIDRVLRIILGFALIVLPFLGSVDFLATGAMKWVSVVVGLVLVATAGMKFCPIYRLFGIRTCKI